MQLICATVIYVWERMVLLGLLLVVLVVIGLVVYALTRPTPERCEARPSPWCCPPGWNCDLSYAPPDRRWVAARS